MRADTAVRTVVSRGPQIAIAFSLLSVAGTGTVVLAPRLAEATSTSDHPSYAIVAITGEILIGLTSLFLVVMSRLIGLGRAWVLFAVIYNASVIAAKFILGPVALYRTTFITGLFSPDYNNLASLFLAGAATLVAYLGVFVILFLVFRSRVRERHPDLVARRQSNTPMAGKVIFCGVVGMLFLIFMGPSCLWLLLIAGPYVAAISATAGIALLAALVAAFASGIATFHQVEISVAMRRDVTLLVAFFWMGIALLVMYQGLWMIYMAILVSVWPIKTIAPSGK